MADNRKTLTLKTPRDTNTPRRRKRTRVEVIVKKKSPITKPEAKIEKKPRVQTPPAPKKKKGPAKLPKKERLPLQEAIAEISHYWPNLFPNGKLRPMQIGLKRKLKKLCLEQDIPLSKKRLYDCLGSIGNSLEYHETIVLGASRFDENGEVCGVIDEDSVNYSEQKTLSLKITNTPNHSLTKT